jgi:predicted RNA methylase
MSAQAVRRENVAAGDPDQWFIPKTQLEKYADLIAGHGNRLGLNVFVDSSCGTGELGELLAERGYEVYMFDIDDSNVASPAATAAPAGACRFQKRDFFTVTNDDVPRGAIIGFNPPFGYMSSMTKRFIRHAATLGPGLMVWMSKNMNRFLPPGYATLEVRSEIVAFNRPGRPAAKQGVLVTVWHADPERHDRELAEIRETRALGPPPGFSVQTLDRVCRQHGLNEKQHAVRDWDPRLRPPHAILVRECGSNAGGQGILFGDNDDDDDTLFHVALRHDGTRNVYERPATDALAPSVFHAVTVPPENGTFQERVEMFFSLAPVLLQYRREQAFKGGCSVNDICRALRLIF